MKYIRNFSVREKILLGLSISGIVACLFLYVGSNRGGEEESFFSHDGFESEVVEENTELAEQNDAEKPLTNEMEFVMVDVKGAVKAPGVYEIEGVDE